MSQFPALTSESTSNAAWRVEDLIASERQFADFNGRAHRDATIDARAALREAFAAAAEAANRALFLAHLLEEVLAKLPDADIAAPHAMPTEKAEDVLPCGTDGLSQREREVLALVAAGLSNKDIAAALFVSPNTVKTHVASLLHKLRAQSRVQLATIAAHCGLH